MGVVDLHITDAGMKINQEDSRHGLKLGLTGQSRLRINPRMQRYGVHGKIIKPQQTNIGFRGNLAFESEGGWNRNQRKKIRRELNLIVTNGGGVLDCAWSQLVAKTEKFTRQ